MSFYKETTGFIIHQRHFSDNSLIIEFFSKDNGLMHILAKGIKTNKKLKSQLKTFCLLKIQYFGRSQLKKMAQINLLENIDLKDLVDKTVGLYLNELIHHSLTENDQADELFECYHHALQRIGHEKLSSLLRRFEYVLLKHNGFELSVDGLDDDAWLAVDKNMGLISTNKHNQKLCQVVDVKDFLSHRKLSPQAQKNFNKLMLNMIDLSLADRPIHARDMLKTLLS